MTRDMVVKLCDFGLAREVAALRDPNQYTFCGKSRDPVLGFVPLQGATDTRKGLKSSPQGPSSLKRPKLCFAWTTTNASTSSAMVQ